jgi:thiazole synthase ThiGH ThiG subunit
LNGNAYEFEHSRTGAKLEVIGDERTLFPDNEALIEATRIVAVAERLRPRGSR